MAPSSELMRRIPHTNRESLDIEGILSTHSLLADNPLLATSMSFSPSNGSLSFPDIPSFGSLYDSSKLNTYKLPSQFCSIREPASPSTSSPLPTSGYTTTIPTTPRMKCMLLEPIVVSQWNQTIVPTGFEHMPWQDGLTDPKKPAPPWIPEGSIHIPEVFQAIRRSTRAKSFPLSVGPVSATPPVASEFQHAEFEQDSSTLVALLSADFDHSATLNSTNSLSSSFSAPTVTISRSGPIIPPAESTPRQPLDAPLAVRRGHKLPSPLLLKSNIKSQPIRVTRRQTLSPDTYPGIPTPFLGSPSKYSPEFHSIENPKTLHMDLNAICADLRARCPPIRPETPQISPKVIHTPKSFALAGDINCPSDFGDDWVFAEKILKEFAGDAAAMSSFSLLNPGTPCSLLDQSIGPCDVSVLDSLSFSKGDLVSLRTNEESDHTTRRTSVLDEVKQQRRRTVIVETPGSSNNRQQARASLASEASNLSKESSQLSPGDHDAVPFEPTSPVESIRTSERFSRARPPSSASMRPPAKGILKEKKCVRFSIIPSMHEFIPEEHEDPDTSIDSSAASDDVDLADTDPQATTHIRQSKQKSDPLLRQVSATPSKPDDGPSTNKLSHFPKHPVIRSMIKGPTLASKKPPTPLNPAASKRPPLRPKGNNAASSSGTVAKTADSKSAKSPASIRTAMVGNPMKLKPKSPAMSKSPLPRPVAKFSQPVSRPSSAPPVKSRRSDGDDGSTTTPASRRPCSTTISSGRKSGPVSPQKSRMPVPFRSILTKLRT